MKTENKIESTINYLDRKVYPLSRKEREEIREFIKEQLKKGYIWPFKLLQTALVFFVGKKDGKK